MYQRVCVRFASAALAALLLAGSPAAAAEEGGSGGEPSEMAREGVEQIMKALETFLSQIPRYGTPYVDDEGNIVIPRLNEGEPGGDGGGAPAEEPDTPAEQTET